MPRNNPVINLPHMGDTKAPVLVVLDPVIADTPFDYPIRKPELDWLSERLFQRTNLERKDIQFLACAPSVTFEENKSNKFIGEHLKKHSEDFVRTVNELSPKLIVPMGATAARQVIGRAVQITKIRGVVAEHTKHFPETPVFPCLSSFYARRHPENEALFNNDLETLGSLFDNDYDHKSLADTSEMEIEWCYDIQHLLDNQPAEIAFDLETLGLDPRAPESRVLAAQITYRENHALVIPIDYDIGDLRHHKFIKHPCHPRIYRKRIIRQLKQLLENRNIHVAGQNLKFDWLFCKYKLGIEIANYSDDTLLMAHLLDENMMSKSIDDLARVYVPKYAGFNDVLNTDPEHKAKERMDLFTPEKFLQYSGGDTIVTFALKHELEKRLKQDPELCQCYLKTVMPAIREFCYVELNGFSVNLKALKQLEKEVVKEERKTRKWLLDRIPASIKNKHKDTGVGLKPDRAVILIDYLYKHRDGLKLPVLVKTKTGKPSVSTKEAMPYYVADSPWIAKYVEYTKLQKMLSTYIKGFYKHIREGRIFPTFSLHKAVTGRSNSENPNGQNLPKRGRLAKLFRKVFQAPTGWVYTQSDLSQAELRFAAMISGDENMLQIYRDGGDIHRTTAASSMKMTLEEFAKLTKDAIALGRFRAKAVNFGYLYGMWWKKFRQYAKTEYGLDYTEEEAQETRVLFFEKFPRLADYHDAAREFVREHGYVRAFNGRVRHLPMVNSPDKAISQQAERYGINAPIQSIASDTGLMAMSMLGRFLRKRGLDKYIKICGFIHDSIVMLVKEEYAAYALRTAKFFMENVPFRKWFDWKPIIPIVADAEIGPNLADTIEVPFRMFSKESGNRTWADIKKAYDEEEAAKASAKEPEKRRKRVVPRGASGDNAGKRRTIRKTRDHDHAETRTSKGNQAGIRKIRRTQESRVGSNERQESARHRVEKRVQKSDHRKRVARRNAR